MLALIGDPRFAPVFAPGSRAEVSIVGRLDRPGRSPALVSGQIDRLVVTADEVLIVDFKTNHAPPKLPAEAPPGYVRQLALYRAVLDAAGPKPVTFRTLDIGGDKALPYMETVIEENPALGWRAIRLGLDRPGLLRGQIRALLRAGGGRALRIMFPMISEVAEFDLAKGMVERELTYLRQHGHALPERIDVGTMVEVPALLYQLDELLKKVDFLSVGSNDLSQFMFAVDRGNAKVSERFDTMSAPILRALRDIVRKAQAANKGVSLCGEMASKPLGALALIALGYRSLSLSATAHGPVKALILDLDAKKAEAMMTPLLDAPSGSVSIRKKLTEFAEAEGLSL